MCEQNKNSSLAFTVWEVVILILVVTFLVAIAMPNFVNRNRTSPANACINDLRQIDAAASQIALDKYLTNGTPINFPDDLTNYIKLNRYGKISPCPSGGTYHINKVGEIPTCSLGSTVTPAHVLP
jgi:type II secretory pathway pseudopilin PulG